MIRKTFIITAMFCITILMVNSQNIQALCTFMKFVKSQLKLQVYATNLVINIKVIYHIIVIFPLITQS